MTSGLAVWALGEIAKVSTPELNPDGVDQAAHTMRLIAVEALTELGEPVPEQRTSMANHPAMANTCICGRQPANTIRVT